MACKEAVVVVVAKRESSRPLRLLDLERIHDVGVFVVVVVVDDDEGECKAAGYQPWHL